MRFSLHLQCVLIFLLAIPSFSPALAQESSVLSLTGGSTPADLPSIVLALKAIGQIRQVEANPTQLSIRVSGTPDEIALAQWLLRALDRPDNAPVPLDAASSEYRLPDESGLWVKVFQLSHMNSPEARMELVAAIRSVGDVRMILPSPRQSVISMRGPESQIRLAAWLIGELDRSSATPGPGGAKWLDYPAPYDGDIVRLYRLPEGPARKELTANLASLAQATGVQRLSPITVPGSERALLAARAKPEQLERLGRAIYPGQ